MTYILAYLLIGFCTYMLMKNWLYKLTAPIGGPSCTPREAFYSGIQELFSAMDEQDIEKGKIPDERWKVIPENFTVATVLTLLMVWCCISWPVTILWMAWQQINNRTWEEVIYEDD